MSILFRCSLLNFAGAYRRYSPVPSFLFVSFPPSPRMPCPFLFLPISLPPSYSCSFSFLHSPFPFSFLPSTFPFLFSFLPISLPPSHSCSFSFPHFFSLLYSPFHLCILAFIFYLNCIRQCSTFFIFPLILFSFRFLVELRWRMEKIISSPFPFPSFRGRVLSFLSTVALSFPPSSQCLFPSLS